MDISGVNNKKSNTVNAESHFGDASHELIFPGFQNERVSKITIG